MVCVKRNIRDQGIQVTRLVTTPNKKTGKIPVFCSIVISFSLCLFIPYASLSLLCLLNEVGAKSIFLLLVIHEGIVICRYYLGRSLGIIIILPTHVISDEAGLV